MWPNPQFPTVDFEQVNAGWVVASRAFGRREILPFKDQISLNFSSNVYMEKL